MKTECIICRKVFNPFEDIWIEHVPSGIHLCLDCAKETSDGETESL